MSIDLSGNTDPKTELEEFLDALMDPDYIYWGSE